MNILKPRFQLQFPVIVLRQNWVRDGDSKSANIANVFHVSLCLAVYLLNAIIQYDFVQFVDLAGYIVRQICAVLQKNTSHHNFQRIAILRPDCILTVRSMVDPRSNPILEYLDVLSREKGLRQFGVVPYTLSRVPKRYTLISGYLIIHLKQR